MPASYPFPSLVGARLIREARAGCTVALGRLLEACRAYLLRIAAEELDDDLRTKVAPADLVQETFLAAVRDYYRFQGHSLGEMHAWLRQVLLHYLGNLRRHYTAQKRAITLEQPLEGVSADLWSMTASPSVLTQRNEEQSLLEWALGRLPAEYRQVLVLWCEGLSYQEIGWQMGRTAEAVRKLWEHSVARLRRELGERN